MSRDTYLGSCVLCGDETTQGADFCAGCSGQAHMNFGRCYECGDGEHGRCIGLPCQCPCPWTEEPVVSLSAEAFAAECTRLQGLIDAYANSIGARGHTEEEYYARLNAAEEALLDAATPRKPEEGS